jgi:hypothetical protein
MSESEQKETKVIVARKYETADEFLARRKKEDAERKKQEAIERRKQTRKLRLPEYTPYSNSSSKAKSKSLSKEQELALSGINEMNNRKEIAVVKKILDITPSKKVPEGVNPFLPTPMELGLIRSEEKEDVTPSTNPVALDFDVGEELEFDELDKNEQLPPNIKRIGGIKRRKLMKLRKSSKKSRKSKRKTTRKVRRHRRH